MKERNLTRIEEEVRNAEDLIKEGRLDDAVRILSALLDKDGQPSLKGKNRIYAEFLLGKAFYLNSSLEESERVFVPLLAKAESTFGPSHRFTLLIIGLLAKLMARKGAHDDASLYYLREGFQRRGITEYDASLISESYEQYCEEKALYYNS